MTDPRTAHDSAPGSRRDFMGLALGGAVGATTFGLGTLAGMGGGDWDGGSGSIVPASPELIGLAARLVRAAGVADETDAATTAFLAARTALDRAMVRAGVDALVCGGRVFARLAGEAEEDIREGGMVAGAVWMSPRWRVAVGGR